MVGDLNKRKGVITATETKSDITSVEAEVPLKDMFGYAGDLRSMTQVCLFFVARRYGSRSAAAELTSSPVCHTYNRGRATFPWNTRRTSRSRNTSRRR